jgi:hypothetical protein
MKEYRRRIDRAHSTTGVPSYWPELQKALQDIERWKEIARVMYDRYHAGDGAGLIAAYEDAVRTDNMVS